MKQTILQMTARIAVLESRETHRIALEAEVLALRRKYAAESERRRQLQVALSDAWGNLRVMCRIRPAILQNQLDQHAVSDDGGDVVMVSTTVPTAQGARHVFKSFAFDRVFGPSSSQNDVAHDVEYLVSSLLDGFNASIAAYGQTGSGKTFTMLGEAPGSSPTALSHGQADSTNSGLLLRLCAHLFARIDEKKDERVCEVHCSIFEIYNNKIRDLLPETDNVRHEVQTTADGQSVVTGLTSVRVGTLGDVSLLLAESLTRRAQGATNVHAHSSRSHCLVRLTCRCTYLLNNVRTLSTLNFIDLAGSECVADSGVLEDALHEAKQINKSLAALADVFQALSRNSAHVPYRNSTLTHYLQDALGGQAKFTLIVCVPPSSQNLSESTRTLQFGEKARRITRGRVQRQVIAGEFEAQGKLVSPPKPSAGKPVSSPALPVAMRSQVIASPSAMSRLPVAAAARSTATTASPAALQQSSLSRSPAASVKML
eukprot:m.13318 g.13318  ORF g.13318 m.13318 type:complete len:485 (-) comp19696_c0_seq1:10-1464(-)